MKEELEKKLRNKYPSLFTNNKESTTTCIGSYGFEHGNGWYSILEKLCENIIKINNEEVEFDQIKEKFGTLRIYLRQKNPDIQIPEEDCKAIKNLIFEAEIESSHICENCGAEEAKLRQNGWMHTYCDSCQKEYECQSR